MRASGKIFTIAIILLLVGINFISVIPAGNSKIPSEGRSIKLIQESEQIVVEGEDEPTISEEPPPPISYGPGDPEPTGPDDEVDALGPYGTPTNPYYEGDTVYFDAYMVNGTPADYYFLWDVNNDGYWDNEGMPTKGDTNFTHQYTDDYIGYAKVAAWDGSSMKNVSGNGTMFNEAPQDTEYSINGYQTIGVKFKTDVDCTLDALGAFNGTNDIIHNLRLWDDAGTLYAQVLDPEFQNEGWEWFSIPPIALTAGNDYIVSAGIYTDQAPFINNPGETSDGYLEPLGFVYYYGSAWGFPGSYSFYSPLPMVDVRYSWRYQVVDAIEDLAEVCVLNVAPTVEAGPDILTMVGDKVFFHGSFTDPGKDDTHEIQWNFRDGKAAHGSLDVMHIYNNPGVYTVTLLVVDDDKGGGFDRLTVVVRDRYTIQGKIQNLIKMTKSLNLPDGIENSLISKLNNALASYEMGNYKAAMNKILAFILHVGALQGKKIPFEQADELISSALVIRNLLLEKLG